jgi:hypothetical protein
MLVNKPMKALLVAVFVVSQVDAWLWSSASVEEPPEPTPPPPLSNQHDHVSAAEQAHQPH